VSELALLHPPQIRGSGYSRRVEDQPALTTAIIAASVALAVAAVTNAVSLIAGWRQRIHERRLAHTEREYQRRADAYLEAMTLINHGMDWVNRTLPVISPGPEPPPPLDEDALRRANALIALFGSDETRTLMTELAHQQRGFQIHVESHEEAKRAGTAFGDNKSWGSWDGIEASREKCREVRTQIEQAMRRDLGTA